MKRIISILIVSCMIFMSLVSISASDPTTVYYDKISGNIEDNVEISVGIKNNAGIAGLLTKIEYDSSELEITDIINGDAFSDAMFTTPDMSKDISSPFVVSWISLNGLNKNGTILKIKATLKKNISDKYPIDIVSCEANDIEEKDVHILVDNGAVPIVRFDEVTVRPGETIEVPIKVENNPGISALGIKIDYDNTILKLESVQNADVLSDAQFEYGKLSNQPIILNWTSITNSLKNGTLVKLRFSIKEQAADGTTPLNITVTESVNSNEIDVPLYGKQTLLTISNTANPTNTTKPAESDAPTETQKPTDPNNTPLPIKEPNLKISNAHADTMEITADVKNISNDTVSAKAIIAAYDRNGALLSVVFDNIDRLAPSSSVKMGMLAVTNASYYKIMVWDMLKNMRPIADCKQLNIQ